MHIKQIELFGFKSFVDKAIVTFSTGICAVVGPNGCGKSNLVDAVRWVLGEQSAKQLRGKLMEEVIFNGANGRPSLNFAEVSLVLSNEDGKVPPPYHEYSEIMVTRRLFRSGDSEYYINRTPCRRMDISKLFMDTGIGHRHYAIIEQGKISHVVESKPEDIRALIEEAAGITKFKVKKRAALRKIELTKQNLLRLGDIISEVSRQLSSLKRQARRANRYRTLKKEIKRLEITRSLHHYRRWQQEVAVREQDLRSQEDAQSQGAAHLAGLDSEITNRSSRMRQLEEAFQRSRETLFRINNEISSDENNLLHLQRQTQELAERRKRLSREIEEQAEREQQLIQERDLLAAEQQNLAEACSAAETLATQLSIDLNQKKLHLDEMTTRLDEGKADLVDLLGEMAGVRNQQLSTSKRLEELDRRRRRREKEHSELQSENDRLQPQSQRLDQEIAATRTRMDRLTAEADDLSRKSQEFGTQLQECKQAITAHEASFHKHQSQLQVFAEMERSYAWFSDAVRTIITAMENDKLQCNIRGAVAELLEVDAVHRGAVEAVLGGRLQALVVDSPLDACTALKHLKRTGAGRNYFIPLSLVNETPEPVTSDDGPVPLRTLVRPRPGYEPVVHFLLANVLYCTDLEQALNWWQAHPQKCVLVTPEGDLIAQDGTLWGGSQEQQISILEKQDQRRSLEVEVATLANSLEAENFELQQIEERHAQVTSGLESAQKQMQQLRNQLLEHEKERYRLDAEKQMLTERVAMLELEREQDEEEIKQLQVVLSQNERTLEDLEESRQDLERNLEGTQEERRELTSLVESLNEQATSQQVSVGGLVEKKEAARASYERVLGYHAEVEKRLQQLEAEREACKNQTGQLGQEEQETRGRLERARRHLQEQEATLGTEEKHWREFESRQHELEARRIKLLQEDKQQEQDIQRLRHEVAELNLKIQYVIHQAKDRYHLDLSKETASELEESVDLERLDAKVQRLRDRVARIGEVNLTAIQEYEDQSKRHEFLTAQRDDLIQSLDGLKKAISRINKTTRKRFLQTLEAVNRKLEEVFPLLFNGGSGHLQLLTDRDPLEAGVEILVQPPGKRLTSMTLLSGGEKALAAAALLFSLYMIRPSPFCILDEVDAPLDDANIDRFIKVLKRISLDSQVILITHNKRTMETSDLLLGVTMEEPGISKIISVNFQGLSDTHEQMV
ncbi:MAG: chromosome segregation protein SMC [Deltaproteobacteria bacterium]|nr:MAG: chromosome segregation protein SMC [Deltaproteobacteria bacterium]